MKYLFILNDSPYGIERTFNGLRLASSLSKQEGETVSVFLMGDAVACSLKGQSTPNGYYNIERMMKVLASRCCTIGVCGSCMDARGLNNELLVEGARRSSMDELTSWTQEADKVLVF